MRVPCKIGATELLMSACLTHFIAVADVLYHDYSGNQTVEPLYKNTEQTSEEEGHRNTVHQLLMKT